MLPSPSVSFSLSRNLGKGLRYIDQGTTDDLSVTDQQRGPMISSPWLEFGKIEVDGFLVPAARLAGSRSGQLATPENWSFEGSLSQTFGFASTEEFGRLEIGSNENGLQEVKSPLSAKTYYIGRTDKA
jgi:hypothetical protein